MTSSFPDSPGVEPTHRLPYQAVRVDRFRRLCRDAAAIDCPFELERRTSTVLGRVWLRRAPLPNPPGDDLMLLVARRSSRSGSAAS